MLKIVAYVRYSNAQIMFEKAAKGDKRISCDAEHLRSGQIANAFHESLLKSFSDFDVIISDSSTCTRDPGPDFAIDEYDTIRDNTGSEFQNEVFQNGFKGWYQPMWGKRIPDFEWWLDQNAKYYEIRY